MQDLSCLSIDELEQYLFLCQLFLLPLDTGSMPDAAYVWKEEMRKVEIELFERTILG